ncbi:MAG TPA: hypothetical protein VEV83_17020 [Parafilimonas sp.]|nr:hypothetical protein [Parafilimonas sp.]
MVQSGVLYQLNHFYSIRNDAALIERRLNGNNLAAAHMKKAQSVARLLSWLPYVRGIAISGSLSKNFADENSDLDFFIITAANRLWIVRIVYSIIYKFASLAGVTHWFCLNYFVDELGLEIKERNIFTAIELSTLMPVRGADVFRSLFHTNNWVEKYLPNYMPNYSCLKEKPASIVKRLAEWAMNFEYGNTLDDKLQVLFQKRFERQTTANKKSEKGLTIGAYEAGKHICKPMPEYFQPMILKKFEERFKMVEQKFHAHLTSLEKILVPNFDE